MSRLKGLQYLSQRLMRKLSGSLRSGKQPNCILLLQYMVPLGGCVHATALIRNLAEAFPDRTIAVATHGVGFQVLRHNPHVGALLVTPDALVDFRAAGDALVSHLKREGLVPAWVLTDLSNPRSKIALLNTVYLRRSLAGFSLASGLQDISLQRDSSQSLIANHKRLVQAIGGLARDVEPQVFTSPQAAATARGLLAEVNPDALPVAVFSTCASGGQPSEWHTDRMRQLVASTAQAGLLPLFVGTAGQADRIDELRLQAGVHTVSVAGRTDVPALAALLALADLCVSIDTGTMHVARSSGVPMLVLAPTYQDAVEWLPLGVPQIEVLRGEGTAPVGSGYRLDEITAEAANRSVGDLLARYPPASQAREERLRAILSETDHQQD